MMPTQTFLDKQALDKINKGVNAIYNPVRKTFGPEGSNGLIYGAFNREPRITNDGYTIAEAQDPKGDEAVRLTAKFFKEACKKTNELVGDATTATTIIGGKLWSTVYNIACEQSLMNNVSKTQLRKNILKTAEKVKEEIRKSAKKIKTLEDLEKIAIISVEDEEIGKRIAKLAWDVGKDGYIDVQDGFQGELEIEINTGMRFPGNIVSKAFVNVPEKHEMVAEDCPVIVTNYNIDNLDTISNAIRPIIEKYKKVVILAESFTSPVLQALYKSMLTFDSAGKYVPSGYKIFPVSIASMRGERLEDVAVYCGGNFINKKNGDRLESISIEDVGFLEKMVVKDIETREEATITGGAGTKLNFIKDEKVTGIKEKVEEEVGETRVEKRITILKGQLKSETRNENFRAILERRIASMNSAVGIIRVGDSTRAQSYYMKKKIEDCVFACRTALRSGFVKGGGLCLKEIADKLPETDILRPALEEPYKIIQDTTHKEITPDIVDPADSIYYAVEHSTKVVAQLITSSSITVESVETPIGDGIVDIKNVMLEGVIKDKIKEGQIKSGEEEKYRQELGGMTPDEYIYSNKE